MNSKDLKKNFFYSVLVVFFISSFLFFASGAAKPETASLIQTDSLDKRQEIKELIDKKNQEFQEVSNKIKENQKNLEEVKGQGKSLQGEIKKIDSNINQVGLGIKTSEITLDKLGLEINSIGYNINDAQEKVSEKEQAINKILGELQQKENESPLIIFLKNKSLADSFFEAQSLSDLNHSLSVEVEILNGVKTDLKNDLREKSSKKDQVESEKENLKNKKLILADTKQDKQTLLKQTKNKEQIYQKTISELEKRQSEIAAEIEKMDAELRLKINPNALPQKRAGVLAMPVSGTLSQGYGATSFAKYGYRGKWHNGLDYAAPIGTPIFAAEKGEVVAAGNQDNYCYRGAYGKFLIISHENNLTTLYAHLSLQIVKKGDIVERGQLIGYVGKTGYSTGSHLHFTVYSSPTFKMGPSKVCGPMPFGGDLNPLDYL
ncbi:peptidoglycan DD-metalloendopeptidase family protein [Candidatus Wolfebacteria bacterium]|nr:peptidoglycan DD-metalloendopeptidase family protein [Candidatus Wolfebacteria bacterium]